MIWPGARASICLLFVGSAQLYAQESLPGGIVTGTANEPRPKSESVELKFKTSVDLGKTSSISGKVLDESGVAAVGQSVAALQEATTSTRAVLREASRATTDEEGVFRLTGLAPGAYLVVAVPANWILANETSGLIPIIKAKNPGPKSKAGEATHSQSVRTYYPSVTTPAEAVEVVLRGIEVSGIAISMRTEPTYVIRGSVEMELRRPGNTLRVIPVAEPYDPSAVLGASIGDDGSFTVKGLALGNYRLQLTGPVGSGSTGLLAAETLFVKKDEEGIELKVLAHPTISGVISGVDATVDLSTSHVDMESTEPLLPVVGVISADVGKDGRFQISGLDATKYNLRTVVPSGTYVKSIRFGGMEVAGSVLDLTSGAFGTLEIKVSSAAAEISGSVTAANPAIARVAVIYPGNSTAGTPPAAIAGIKEGHFDIHSLAPGRYYVAAFETFDPAVTKNSELWNELHASFVRIDVQERQRSSVDIPLITDERIHSAAVKVGLINN